MTGVACATCLAAAAALSATQPRPSSPPPKLLVVISVDQFSADLFDEYRPQFTGGLARLASGTVFRNGYQSHAATETCPGHSTILTGDHPARTGIIANTWIDQSVAALRQDASIAPRTRRVPGTISIALHGLADAPAGADARRADEGALARQPQRRGRRQGPRGGDDGRAQRRPALVLDRQAVRHRPRRRRGARRSSPKVERRRRRGARARRGRRSSRRRSARPRRARSPIEGGGKPVGAGRFARAAGDAGAFRASPEFDGDTLALAAGLVDEMQLGRGADPDLLAIGLSATDYVGHTYGTEGEEMCLQLTRARPRARRLLRGARQPRHRLCGRADRRSWRHGHSRARARWPASPTRRASTRRSTPAAIGQGARRQARPRRARPARRRRCGDIYVDRSLKPARPHARCCDAAVAAYRAHPQVEAVFTARQIARDSRCRPARPTSWTPDPARPRQLRSRALGRFRRGSQARHHADRRHHALCRDPRQPVGLRPARADPVLAAGHAAARPSSDAVETTDIMPTLAALIGLPLAAGSIDGHCLDGRSRTSLARHAKHLKSRDFSFIESFRHEGAD